MPVDYRSQASRRQTTRRGQRRRRHLWYARIAVGAIVALLAAVLYFFHSVLLPFVIAGIIVYVLEPFVRRLHRQRVPRVLAVMIAYLIFFGGVYLFGHYLLPKLEHESKKIIGKLHIFVRDTPGLFKRFESNVENLLAGPGETEASFGEVPLPPAFKWGLGPDLSIPNHSEASQELPALPSTAMAADAHQWLRDPNVALAPEAPKDEALSPDEQTEESRSQLLIARIREGLYGVQLRDSALQVESLGEGRYNFIASDEPQEASAIGNMKSAIMKSLRGGLEKLAGRILGGFFSSLQGILTGIVSAFVGILFTFLVAAFVLIDYDRLVQFFKSRIPPRHRSLFDELTERLDTGLRGVVRGQLLICLINGVLSGIGFAIFIPEYTIVMAILAGCMSLIPIFGTIISTAPAVLIGLTDSFGSALAVLAWILGIHFVEAYVLNPKIIGTQARMHPVTVIFVIVAGASMFGMTGALLATPVTAIAQAVIQTVYRRAEPLFMRDM